MASSFCQIDAKGRHVLHALKDVIERRGNIVFKIFMTLPDTIVTCSYFFFALYTEYKFESECYVRTVLHIAICVRLCIDSLILLHIR